jgi:hypothetical protein
LEQRWFVQHGADDTLRLRDLQVGAAKLGRVLAGLMHSMVTRVSFNFWDSPPGKSGF